MKVCCLKFSGKLAPKGRVKAEIRKNRGVGYFSNFITPLPWFGSNNTSRVVSLRWGATSADCNEIKVYSSKSIEYRCFLCYCAKTFFFGQNVWHYRLMNTAMASFNTTVRQMTEMFQWPKCRSKKMTKCISEKKAGAKCCAWKSDRNIVRIWLRQPGVNGLRET